MQRRLFLKSALAAGSVATAISAGLLTPGMVFANTKAFKTKSDTIMGQRTHATKGGFKLKVPKVAENGAVVPVTVDASKMSGVSNISILVQESSSSPLAASFALTGAVGFVSTRIKMAKTSPVIAMVTANGQIATVDQEVKVTVGGCGG